MQVFSNNLTEHKFQTEIKFILELLAMNDLSFVCI